MENDLVIADFRVEGTNELEEMLESAVRTARHRALVDRTRGALVTRHDFGHFSVALSPKVPFGFTREHDSAGSRRD